MSWLEVVHAIGKVNMSERYLHRPTAERWWQSSGSSDDQQILPTTCGESSSSLPTRERN